MAHKIRTNKIRYAWLSAFNFGPLNCFRQVAMTLKCGYYIDQLPEKAGNTRNAAYLFSRVHNSSISIF